MKPRAIADANTSPADQPQDKGNHVAHSKRNRYS